MLKLQVVLIAVLIGCIGFVACERTQTVLEPVMMGTTEMVMEMDAYKSWASVDLPAPEMTVEEAKAAMNPAETGQAHGVGIRTVYFNELAAMANMAEMAETEYPDGSIIVKEVMNADNTEVVHVATMMKMGDMMYDAHNGWVYGTPQPMTVENSAGCHDCHANAPNDSVFVSLSMADGAGDTNGDGAGDTNGDGAGDTNGDGAGDTNGDGAGN
jgi:hypothetical protein